VDPPIELSLILEHLQALGDEDLEEARELLFSRFHRERAPARRIALIGLRGAGKSTLGRALAVRFDMPFVRLVDEIEREAGMEVGEILALSGYRRYRRLQRRALERVIGGYDAAVIEVAGSLVTEPAMFNSLLASAWTVWLRASPEEHMSRVIEQGDLRPMAGNEEAMEDLRRILAARDPFYRRADAIIDTAGRDVPGCLGELESVCGDLLATGGD
jgi:XRE family transcriptional regulator, aerobic/anaerobic benzoate catabolism transcriptional regulator